MDSATREEPVSEGQDVSSSGPGHRQWGRGGVGGHRESTDTLGGLAGARARGPLPSRRQGHGQAPRERSWQRPSVWGQCQALLTPRNQTGKQRKARSGLSHWSKAACETVFPAPRSGWDGMPATKGTGVHADRGARGAGSTQFRSGHLTSNTIKIQLTGQCWIRGQTKQDATFSPCPCPCPEFLETKNEKHV